MISNMLLFFHVSFPQVKMGPTNRNKQPSKAGKTAAKVADSAKASFSGGSSGGSPGGSPGGSSGGSSGGSPSKLAKGSLFGKKFNVGELGTELLQGGVFVAWVTNTYNGHGSYLAPIMMKALEEESEEKGKIGLDAILNRRGEGKKSMLQKPGSTYPFKQFVFLIDDDADESTRTSKAKEFLTCLKKYCFREDCYVGKYWK